VLRERWLPDGHPRVAGAGARNVTERRVPARERASVALKRRQVAPRGERQRDVQEVAPLAWRAGDEVDVAWRDHHGGQRPQGLAQSRHLAAIAAHALASTRALEADRQLVRAVGPQLHRQVKARLAEAHELLVARAADGTKELGVIDGFEQVRLPVPIVANDDESVRGWGKVDPCQVAEITHGEAQEHGTARGGKRFSDMRRRGHYQLGHGTPGSLTTAVSSSVTTKLC
jgi:hypothetical protein